ncbi:sarcosine oxidase [Maritalea myrionectae]|uniref:Sarcosine oxidase n=1 Tax=Maritalea myrionectae TaxID=454601 RepID=A0A2R4M9S1_9HYPH|nr:sarcosine oxidase subunit delta [Maritalea myrionectae]AVX02599.1 sarcosine oxidase [Maritalea myrionectae]
MMMIECPICNEKRPELEFRYAGEAHIARPENPSALSDDEWAKYLFIRNNPRGTHFERWVHAHGCAKFFNAVRDTVSDKFVMTYKCGEQRPSSETIAERSS